MGYNDTSGQSDGWHLFLYNTCFKKAWFYLVNFGWIKDDLELKKRATNFLRTKINSVFLTTPLCWHIPAPKESWKKWK